MRQKRYLRLFAVVVTSALAVLGLAPAGASSANISHSYKATSGIQNGSLVSLDAKRSDYVLPANTDNATQLLGVAVASNDSLIAVDDTPGAIQVATTGVATALVSNINGDISVGDQVGTSPFDGLGMKALPGSQIIGLAQTGFKRFYPRHNHRAGN